MAMASFYPLPSKEALQETFVGRSIKDVPTPAAVLDRNKIKRNCDRMLQAVKDLEFGWRAHIKTHKTTELTRLQVGHGTTPVNIIVSTIIEAENVLPLLHEYQSTGRQVNLLYSFPVAPGAIERLSLLAKQLGAGGLCLMVDHHSQLDSVVAIHKSSSIPPNVFLKINVGDGHHRAGVVPQSETCSQMITSLLSLEKADTAHLFGLYSHAGHSYSASNQATALDFLRQEFEALRATAKLVHSTSPSKSLVLSVGATPTSTSIRNLLVSSSFSADSDEGKAIAALKSTIAAIRKKNCDIEIHAGVYPVLDCQQLATRALPTDGPNAMLTYDDLALTIVAEIASVYPGRGENGTPEALLGAGCIALGREPCKAYAGWGVMTPWNRTGVEMPKVSLDEHRGWKVGRISQEHGILTWDGEKGGEEPLEVGMKVRVWPNHACIASAGFGWYLVVDSSWEGKEDEIVDVWPRWRGW
ncbi:putative serine dehydratase domain-containing protein [Amylocarpus encephaloides]|uniref:D-serine dehydratase n=1 Tax=Amylocarpus encephaloides TaxID=45428 RepID=A0A9P7YKF5_9HELO|nr:putative serine dehydratase domain-containing protein [Amylocarpus encephaloides]